MGGRARGTRLIGTLRRAAAGRGAWHGADYVSDSLLLVGRGLLRGTTEGYFGAQPGVVATEAGRQDGAEVVRVTYAAPGDASPVLAKAVLAEAARSRGYAPVDVGEFRLDREPKYYLLKSRHDEVPMPELQASRVNGTLGLRQNPDHLLSPRQLALVRK